MFLEDILLSMNRITEYIEDVTFHEFQYDVKTVDAVIRNFEIIGEAAKNLPNEIKSKYLDLPWNEMYLLRNKVSHAYFGIDYEIIWEIATNYLQENISQIEAIIKIESQLLSGDQ